MPENNTNTVKIEVEENVLFGTVGAFLFSLVGGAMYLLLSRIGFIAALSGLVAVVCAIKGYTFFSKKESKRGIIISVIISALVLIIAWYVGFCLDMINAFETWYEQGEVFYVPTLFEYIPYGFADLPLNPTYFVDLGISLPLAAYGCFSYVGTMLKKQKAVLTVNVPEDADIGIEPASETENDNEVVSESDCKEPTQE